MGWNFQLNDDIILLILYKNINRFFVFRNKNSLKFEISDIFYYYWTSCHKLLIAAMPNKIYDRTSWFSSESIIWHFHATVISYSLTIKQRRESRWCTERSFLYWKILIILKMWPHMELAVLLTTKYYANIISCSWFYANRGKNLILV